MRLSSLLALATAVTCVRGLFRTNKNGEYDLTKTACDRKRNGRTPEQCCWRPASQRYTVQLTKPTNGSCIVFSDGEMPYSWKVVADPKGSDVVLAEHPAFVRFLIPNLPNRTTEGLLLTSPMCVGKDVGVVQDSGLTLDSEITNYVERFPYVSWAWIIGNLPNGTSEQFLPLDTRGWGDAYGVWIVPSCEQLAAEICDGTFKDPPKENAFVRDALKGCKGPGGKGGTGASSGGEEGGSHRGDDNPGKGKGKGRCSAKPHPHSSGHHPEKPC